MVKFSVHQILDYMQSKYGKVCPLGFYLLNYFIAQDLLRTVERNGEIVGVIIFTKIKLKNFDPRDLMAYDDKGNCAYILELCADDTEAIAGLEKQMRDRLGVRLHIGMKRRGKNYFYNYKKFIKKLLGDKIL